MENPTTAQNVPEIDFFDKSRFRDWVDTKVCLGSDHCYCKSLIIPRASIGFDPSRIVPE